MVSDISLAVRPCLAYPMRWSVDFWRNTSVQAGYQYSLTTFDTADHAYAAATEIKCTIEETGARVTLFREEANASRNMIQSRGETEKEIAQHLEAYVKSAFSPLAKFSLASLFDITNWVKSIKTIAIISPHLLSLAFLAALLGAGPFERLLSSIIPKELDLSVIKLLAAAPLFVVMATFYTYWKRKRLSNQLDRVRQWILQAVVLHNWDRNRIKALVRKELRGLEYASIVNGMEVENSWPADLLRDDFARKIQALAGLAAEPDYRPNQLAIFPLHLLLSIFSVYPTILGLTPGGRFSVASSKDFFERKTLRGMMLFLILSMLVILPGLLWSTALAWHVSPILFFIDMVAVGFTVLLLTRRPLAVAFRRSFLPKGLALHECVGVLNLV